MPGSFFEILMHIHVFTIGMANFSEPVHIKLANKWRKVAMLEVNGQNLLRELGDILDIEAIGCWSPTDRIWDGFILLFMKFTSSISTSLEMKMGIWALFPFLLRLRFILLLYHNSFWVEWENHFKFDWFR